MSIFSDTPHASPFHMFGISPIISPRRRAPPQWHSSKAIFTMIFDIGNLLVWDFLKLWVDWIQWLNEFGFFSGDEKSNDFAMNSLEILPELGLTGIFADEMTLSMALLTGHGHQTKWYHSRSNLDVDMDINMDIQQTRMNSWMEEMNHRKKGFQGFQSTTNCDSNGNKKKQWFRWDWIGQKVVFLPLAGW